MKSALDWFRANSLVVNNIITENITFSTESEIDNKVQPVKLN